jgi:hypothetical protein
MILIAFRFAACCLELKRNAAAVSGLSARVTVTQLRERSRNCTLAPRRDMLDSDVASQASRGDLGVRGVFVPLSSMTEFPHKNQTTFPKITRSSQQRTRQSSKHRNRTKNKQKRNAAVPCLGVEPSASAVCCVRGTNV